jgi:hypothetical protein
MRRIIGALLLAFVTSFWGTQALAAWAEEVENKLTEYVAVAKEVSNKRLTVDNWKHLVSMSTDIVLGIKQYVNETLQTKSFTMERGEDEKTSSSTGDLHDKRLIRFTNAIYAVYQNLDENGIALIAKRSPLELVSIMRELYVFALFVTADPSDYGHGVFSEKDGETTKIFATNAAILRIMRPLVYRYLLKYVRHVYKLSRLTSFLCVVTQDDAVNYKKVFEKTVNEMKRSTADNSRIAIAMPKITYQRSGARR